MVAVVMAGLVVVGVVVVGMMVDDDDDDDMMDDSDFESSVMDVDCEEAAVAFGRKDNMVIAVDAG